QRPADASPPPARRPFDLAGDDAGRAEADNEGAATAAGPEGEGRQRRQDGQRPKEGGRGEVPRQHLCPRSQTPFGNVRLRNSVSLVLNRPKRSFENRPFPNGVWEREG